MEDNCGICLNKFNFEGKQLSSIKCGHWYHKECLETYINTMKQRNSELKCIYCMKNIK